MKIFVLLIFLVWGNPLLAAELSTPPLQDVHFFKATFAGGCFIYLQQPFDDLQGVKSTVVGYTGGHTPNPTYKEVTSGKTGHVEAVEILYDPRQITYQKLLDVFWQNIDPTTVNRQFNDIGRQYRTEIFYHSEEQQLQALASKNKMGKSNRYNKEIILELFPAHATVSKIKFSAADPRGATILDDLIKKGILEEVFSTEVCLKRNNDDFISRPSEIKGSDFDEIWDILQQHQMRFYPAEEHFQNYYRKHPFIYKFYRFVSGRDEFIRKYWLNKKG